MNLVFFFLLLTLSLLNLHLAKQKYNKFPEFSYWSSGFCAFGALFQLMDYFL